MNFDPKNFFIGLMDFFPIPLPSALIIVNESPKLVNGTA